MSKAVKLIALIVACLLSPCWAQHTYYISSGIGADTNTSAQAQLKSTPWAHAPGMANCANNCASYVPVAGDQFIFRGGDTWTSASFNLWNWQWSGSAGAGSIYIGVDQTWFTGGSWTRPIMNGGGSPSGIHKFLELASGVSRVTVDNFEWTGMFSTIASPNSGDIDYIDISRNINSHIHIENNYFHGGNVAHDGAHNAHFLIASLGSGDTNNEVDHNVFDNSDFCAATNPPTVGGPTCTLCAVEGTIWSFHDNYVGFFSNGWVTDWATLIYENTFEVIVLSPDNGTDHENGIENNGGTGVIMFNNVIRHFVNAGIVDFQLAPVTSPSYEFNNVLPDMDGGNMQQCYEGSPANSQCVIFNNTAEGGPDSGTPSGFCGRNTGSNTTSAVTNEHCITSKTGTTWWQGSATFTTNLPQSKATANGQGYSLGSTYSFQPTLITGSTVGTGTNMSSTCSTINGLSATAGAACLQDTTYGVTYNVSNHSITGPGRSVTNPRPASTAWDIGAFQFGTQVSLSVTMAGNNAGSTVTSSPAGINCPTTCSATFLSGTSVTLTENPTGQYFAYGFSSPCPTVTNFNAPCTLVISSATSVTANFNHVTLPQLWTNNMEYLFATSNVVNFPTFWLCNGGTRYPAAGNYANTAAGLTQVGNDAEQCRHDTNTGTTIIVPAGQTYSSANGLQITQLAGDNSTQFIVLTSSNPAPLGVTLGSHGIQDNIPSSTKPGLWNPGLTGTSMYYQLGTQIFTIPVGPFTLANNTATNTSQYNDIAHLFTLEATGANQNAFSTCVTFVGGNCTADWDTNNVGVHHIAILNAELRPVAGQASAGAPYKVGLATETLVSQIPNHIHLAYSYVHGDWQEAPMSGCPSACVATGIPAGTNSLPYAMFIAGCLFCSEMYNYVDGNLRPGAEGHGIGLLLAQENKRAHNWIAGGSIGSICGGWGASMPISNFVTCLNDEDRANRYTYPYSWMLAFNGGFNPSGGSFVRKNAHEYKFARFALFDGSICENVDNSGAQNGTACSFKTAQNSGGGAGSNYWTELTHVTASNIIGRTACNGPSFGDRSAAVGNGGGVSMPSQMFIFSNWLFYNLSINLAGCAVSGFSSAPQYSVRNGQSVPSATWAATATRDALGQTTTFTLTAGSGNGVTDFSLGDPLTSTGCSDATFNLGNTVMGPPVLSGSTLGTTAPPLTLIVNNPGTANATATGCTVSNAQGYPNYIFLNHATIIADAGHNGPYDSALSGTNIHALARNISYQNSIFVNGGLSSSSGEGTAASTRDYDPTTFTFNNSFIGGRTAANYTEYPSLASPPTTLYLTPTNFCTGNDPTTGTCLGILAGMSTSTFPLVPGAVGPYIAGDYHAFRLCQATDVACNSKQSLYGAGNTNAATDGADLGVNFATLDAAQNSTLYVCATPCGLGPSIDTIAIVPAPYTPGFLGYNKPVDIFKGDKQ